VGADEVLRFLEEAAVIASENDRGQCGGHERGEQKK
jgi:hypothetical protein